MASLMAVTARMKISGRADVCGDGAPKMGKTVAKCQIQCKRHALLLHTLDDDDGKEVQVRNSAKSSSAASFVKSE